MEAGYLIIVTPADGWGAEWYEMYRTKMTAEARVQELATRYGMEIMESSLGLEAERFDDFDLEHRIARVTTDHLYYED